MNKNSNNKNSNKMRRRKLFPNGNNGGSPNRSTHKESLTNDKKSKPIRKPPSLRKPVAYILKHWKEAGLKLPGEPTSSYARSVKAVDCLLSGTAFDGTEYEKYIGRKFTIREICNCIDSFAARKKPKWATRIYPDIFIYNQYARNGKSNLIYSFEHEMPDEDRNPKLTKALKSVYVDEVLGGTETNFSPEDENKFIAASENIGKFFSKNRERLIVFAGFNEYEMAKCAVEAAKREAGTTKIVTPGWLSSNNMISRRLPAYLSDKGMLLQNSGSVVAQELSEAEWERQQEMYSNNY
jgi:hypothetical protein